METRIIPIQAYGFSAMFKLRELVPVLTSAGAAEARIKERLLAPLGDGWVLAYDFGALVFVGIGAEDEKRLLAAVMAQVPREPRPPLTESFFVEVREGAAAEVRFDRVVVPRLDLDVVDIVALILAQSVSMDYYARDVEEIEAETDRIAAYLRERGRIPGRVRNLVQFIGLCIATRNDVISTLALFDKPDATWESEPLDRLWDGLYRMLELDDRYRAFEAKLRMFQDNLVVLVDLARQRSTLRLETVVVLLILFEVVVMVWQVLHATGHG